MSPLLDDAAVAQRILDHIDRRTTDLGEAGWREPVANYLSPPRFAAELALLRRYPTPLCPAAALPDQGSYLAREAAGTPILAVRGEDGRVRAFRNACRHRGMQLADGAGCSPSFVCRYHGWTYGPDGGLRYVPHAHGFPGLDKSTHGLTPVATFERHGLVFVTQDAPACESNLDDLPELITPEHRLQATSATDVAANWKVLAEGFLEGYHIRSTHAETFFPAQFDNLNVIETFGRNARIAFPYRRINKLREVPPDQRSVEGMLTYLYYLFPNVTIATFPSSLVLTVLEPVTIDRTRLVSYTLVSPSLNADPRPLEEALKFVEIGAAEDREVAMAIQRGLASGANTHFEFGLFETAIRHFHRELHELVDGHVAESC
jgi:phenylpropionate dioxygenase-like ring-hydroxylating dioxygenase large terminal subunit